MAAWGLRAELAARGERRLAQYDRATVAARLRGQFEGLTERPSGC
jgi:hypothetical protein